MTTNLPESFAHYGVKGMRWGVRKSRSESSAKSKTKTQKSADYIESRQLKSRPLSSMSNAEIERLNRRLQLEKSYSELTANKRSLEKGRTEVDRVLKYGETMNRVYKLATSKMVRSVARAILG